MNIIESASKFYTKYKRRIDPHLAFLGAYLTTKFIFRRGKAIISALFQKQVDIANRYEKETFALITGGASGIGKEFALDLARKGFNLILVDCNSQNLENTKNEILLTNKDLFVKTITLDFIKGDNLQFYEQLHSQIQEFDISILINNVGIGCVGIFHRLPNKYILDSFNVNFTAQIMITHTIINKMIHRDNKKSLIINISSATSLFPIPYFFIYGSTKLAFANFFNALALENLNNIDILTLRPYYVSTAMIRHRKGLFVIEPKTLIKDTWKYAGKKNDVTPSWKHQLQIYSYRIMPTWFRNYFNKKTRQQSIERITRSLE